MSVIFSVYINFNESDFEKNSDYKKNITNKNEFTNNYSFLKNKQNGIKAGQNVVICLSGRGDKDVHTVADYLGKEI